MPQRDEILFSFHGWDELVTLEDFVHRKSSLELVARVCADPAFPGPDAIASLKDAKVLFFLQGDPVCRIGSEGAELFPFDPESLEQVRGDDGFVSYRAKMGGYAAYDGLLKIISPIVERDPYTLVYRNIPPLGGLDSPGSFLSFWCRRFREKNHEPEIEVCAPEDAPQLLSSNVEDIPVVTGVIPEEGRDTVVELLVKKESPDSRSGNVDYRDFHNYLVCSRNQLLAIKHDPFEGRSGLSIRGERTAVTPGKEIPFQAGEHIRVEREGDTERFYAEIDGMIHLDPKSISVSELMVVEKDVDLSTGNIVYRKDVLVKGTLTAGFSIYSEGAVFINGAVEAGCEIRAFGDVEVAGGVIGAATSLRANGNVRIGFVQEARIYCEGRLEIIKGSINGHMYGGKGVRILGKGLKDTVSTLIGGTCISMEQVEVPSVGTPNQDTHIILGYNPYAESALRNLTGALKAVERHIGLLMGKIGLDSDPARAKEQIQRMLPGQRSRLKERLVELKKTGEKRGELETQIAERQKEVFQENESLLKLVVQKRLVPKVTVRMKKQEKIFLDPESGLELYLLDEEIQRRIS